MIMVFNAKFYLLVLCWLQDASLRFFHVVLGMSAWTLIATLPVCLGQHFLYLLSEAVTYNCLCNRNSPQDFLVIRRSKVLFRWKFVCLFIYLLVVCFILSGFECLFHFIICLFCFIVCLIFKEFFSFFFCFILDCKRKFMNYLLLLYILLQYRLTM